MPEQASRLLYGPRRRPGPEAKTTLRLESSTLALTLSAVLGYKPGLEFSVLLLH